MVHRTESLLKCPACLSRSVRVIDSRPDLEGHTVRRRRGCSACNHRWNTREVDVEDIQSFEEVDNIIQELDDFVAKLKRLRRRAAQRAEATPKTGMFG